MNVRGLAGTTLGLGVAAEALNTQATRDVAVATRIGLWTVHVVAVILVAMRSRRVPVPGILRKLGLLLTLGGGALAVYSALIEHTREGRGKSGSAETYPPLNTLLSFDEDAMAAMDEPPSDGTYLASRHPALLGYAAFLAGLALFTRSIRLVWAAPLWIAAAVGHAALREEAMRRAYPWYEGYAQNTPMLIPTAESAQAAIDDVRERFGIGSPSEESTEADKPDEAAVKS